MGITITIPHGFMGQCHCGRDAKHKQWAEFLKPIPAKHGLPEFTGVWNFVCDEHKKESE